MHTSTLKTTAQLNLDSIIGFIREQFDKPTGMITLHEPRFTGNERKYVLDAIDSTFVSSVGEYVNRFENILKEVTGMKYAVATVNGTSALHLSLLLVGVKQGDEVLTQPLTFVATTNAIRYCGADPHFVDVERDTMGISPRTLALHLEKIAVRQNGITVNRHTGKRIAACVPMHSFGLPSRIDEIVAVCDQYNIPVVEDAAESLGSFYKAKHTGSFGKVAAFSFNGNKIVTAGGGGAIVTNDEELGKRAKHLSTTAKVPHQWEFIHDEMGYNYRMPNLNAALLCAQLEQLDFYLDCKRKLATRYQEFFKEQGICFVSEIEKARSNYWLCTVLMNDLQERDRFLKFTNEHQVMTRPAWTLMHKLKMFEDCFSSDLSNAEWLADRIVNLPSSVIAEHS